MIITIELGSNDPEKQDIAPLCVMKLAKGEWKVITGTPKLSTSLIWFLGVIQSSKNEYSRRQKNVTDEKKKNEMKVKQDDENNNRG
jgi:hypothetical protein